ncbi:MAG: PEP-CTERM/exosortase system-associated acyltransferase [Nitrosomonadales bacterium]|nr:MAG: PEP-CTERM/exosortase system-associated acyltransferase [Nitrosomonadales bacterium]
MQSYEAAKSEAPRSYFDFCVIDGTRYLQDSYALRYEVYCNEQHFLAPECYPSRLEIDSYDDHAIHVGAINREGVLAGTLRLVLPSALGFPLLEHCSLFSEYDYLTDSANPAPLSAVEISRLAVSKSYRRRANDGLYGVAETGDNMTPQQRDGEAPRRRSRPELVLGLYRTMYQYSKRQGITYWLAAMEKTLLRLLHRYQFGFKPIGPEVDYYGPVTPYLAEIAEMEKGVRQRHPDLFAEFAQGLSPEFMPSKSCALKK